METQQTVPKIHAAIAACMADIGGVAKGRKNQQQGYNYRGIADLALACQPAMARHGIHMVPHRVISEEKADRETKNGGLMSHIRQRIEWRFYCAADGSFVSCETTGEAMDSGDKASNKVMTASQKYALNLIFCIPEDDPEADADSASPEPVAKKPDPAKPVTPAPGDANKVKILFQLLREAGVGGEASTDEIGTQQRLTWVSEKTGFALPDTKATRGMPDELLEKAIGEARKLRSEKQAAASKAAEGGKEAA